jgi:hypothetical protein
MDYVCTRTFDSSKGRRFIAGDEISLAMYNLLSYTERWNFTAKQQTQSSSSSYEPASNPWAMNAFSSSSSSPSSYDDAPQSNDYGGGSFGAAGAGDSWDSGSSDCGGDSGGGD